MTSLGYFAAGAAVPLIPWFITEGTAAKLASVVFTAAASLVVGAMVGRSSDRPPSRAALRQLAIVVGASAVTYGVGKLFGTAVS